MSQNRNDTTSGQHGPKLTVREIPKEQAIGFIRRYHYSKIMPRLNKHYLGFYTGNRLCGRGGAWLGNPAAPKHTEDVPRHRLQSGDYLEIGKMCFLPK